MKSSKNWFVAFLLLAITMFCFARTLGSYFLEDDFGEVAYVSKIVAGNWHMLVSNFTGNYMQIQSMQVFRPWLLMSLLFDFLFWKANAFGYYLTNVLFMFGCSVMFYAVLRQLTNTWGRIRSLWTSAIAAALFAANPLHSEAVSIVVGRVDIICCFFYLLSLWCLLKRGIKGGGLFLLLSGTLAFWLAILTKEMAVCLPVVLAGVGLIMPDCLNRSSYEEQSLSDETRRYSIADRISIALKVSLPLWLSLIVYFVIRFFALGTLVGGYVGSIGAGQMAHILERWRDADTLHRICYPLNLQVFGASSIYHSLLSTLYFLLAAILLSRWIATGLPWRWLFFLILWSLTALLPIYQLWGLSENLDGSRFLFFLTIPLAGFLPIVLLAPPPTETFSRVNYKLEIVSLLCLFGLILVDGKIAYRNNIPWIHAGRQTRACLKQAQKLAAQIGANKRAILLGLPAEREGARMILNGTTFNIMVSPPFTSTSLAGKFVLFAPFIYGNDELINMQRYKDAVSSCEIIGTYLWNYDALKFDRLQQPDPVTLNPAAPPVTILPAYSDINVYPFSDGQGDWKVEPDGIISMSENKNGSSVVVAPLSINPLEYDFVEFDLSRKPATKEASAAVFWAGQKNPSWQDACRPSTRLLPAQAGTEYQTVRLPLSSHWRWLTAGNIVKLRLDLPVATNLKIKNLQLLSGANLVPDLELDKLQPDNTGVYTIGGEQPTVHVYGAAVSGCCSIRIEQSKPNFFFENVPESSGGKTGKAAGSRNDAGVLKSFICQGSSASRTLLRTDFPSPGYYQLRATCLDQDGRTIGERSDPLTLFKTNL